MRENALDGHDLFEAFEARLLCQKQFGHAAAADLVDQKIFSEFNGRTHGLLPACRQSRLRENSKKFFSIFSGRIRHLFEGEWRFEIRDLSGYILNMSRFIPFPTMGMRGEIRA